MDERQRRVGLNETVFREVNERINDLVRTFGRADLKLICECGDRDCAETIEMSAADYEQVRADADQFAVRPGHEDASVESVIAHRETYDLIRKHPGEPAVLAAREDPRGG